MLHFHQMRGLTREQLQRLFRFAMQRLNEERLPQVAGSLTFTTVLSLVPVLTVALAIFSAFPLFATFKASLEAYMVNGMMPSGVAKTIISYLNQFASKSARLSAVGGVALIVTSVLTIATIEQAFNQIWRVRNTRPLLQRILVYWCIITLGPLLIGGSISLVSWLSSMVNLSVDGFPLIASTFSFLAAILVGTVGLTLLYILVPNQRVDWRDAIWGGLLAAVIIEIAKRLFTSYIMQVPTYTVVYGALAVLPIFLMWVYIMWMLTLFGALVAAALPVIRYERWWHSSVAGSEFVDAMVIIRLLRDARVNGELAAVDAALLRAHTRLGYDELQALLQKMAEAGWIGVVGDDGRPAKRRQHAGETCWVLLANPDQLTVLDVFRLFVFSETLQRSEHFDTVRSLVVPIEKILMKSLNAHFLEVEKL